MLGDTYGMIADGGQYRPEWTWVALRDGVVVARAAWWAKPGDERPLALDWFDFTDAEAAVQLLRTAPLEYRPVPDDDVIRAVLGRIQEGSLDAHDLHDIERYGRAGAVEELCHPISEERIDFV